MEKSIERRAVEWLLSGDTGSSSKFICAHMLGLGDCGNDVDGGLSYEGDYPLDPSDLGRCLRMLEKIPEFKPRMHELSNVSPEWSRLCAKWDEIAKCMESEAGINWEKSKRAPETYRLMKLAIKGELQ